MTPKAKQPRIKEFEGKRLVLNYYCVINSIKTVNDIQGMLSYVGPNHIIFNPGKYEFPVLKSNIISIKNQSGKILFETKY